MVRQETEEANELKVRCNRRDFVKAARGAADTMDSVPSKGRGHKLVGKPLPAWKPGEFQVHFIYTGVAESQFWIMPDGTTMLLDCGGHPAYVRGKKALWLLPNGTRHAGEWIARYVARVNPAKTDVDYMMISHHHADLQGRDGWGGFMQAADLASSSRDKKTEEQEFDLALIRGGGVLIRLVDVVRK